MTKADRIRALYAEGKSVAEIAEIVGCRREYVRVAARQRVGGTADAYWRGDRAVARSVARTAYRNARNGGMTPKEAQRKYGQAYSNTMERTGAQVRQ